MIRRLMCAVVGHDWQGGYWKWRPMKYVYVHHGGLLCYRCGKEDNEGV